MKSVLWSAGDLEWDIGIPKLRMSDKRVLVEIKALPIVTTYI